MTKMMKCFSIIVGLLLTANVAMTQEVDLFSHSPTSECIQVVMPQYYTPGTTTSDMLAIVIHECREELEQEIQQAEVEVNEMNLVAGALFYTTEWCNAVLQKVLNNISNAEELKNDSVQIFM
jgi:hypothetical protein